jgi:Putative auto-transporter adhesin, head GIN domain
MKSFIKLLLATLLVAGNCYAFAKPHSTLQADTTFVTVDRHVSDFNSLHISGPFDVHIAQGTAELVTLDAPKEILERIVTEVNNGELNISNKHDNWGWSEKSWWSDKSWWRHHKKIVVHVTVKDLNSIKLSGSGSALFEQGIAANSLKLIVRGSGNMQGKVDVKKLESHISGSGGIKLSGTAESSAISVTGSGNFTAPDLITSNSAVHLSGSGEAKINANDKVDAAISGSGGVSYTGTAKKVTSKKSGSGSISRF